MRSALHRSVSPAPNRRSRGGSIWLVDDARSRDARGLLGGVPLEEVLRRVRALALELPAEAWEASGLESSLEALARNASAVDASAVDASAVDAGVGSASAGDAGAGDVSVGGATAGDAAPEMAPSAEETRDLLHTRLMEFYRNHRSPGAFALLYDMNQRVFFCTIYARARRYGCLVDAADVLQEVFLNIYRYPDRFKSEKPAAFRNWAYTIIRNTLLKSLRAHVRTSSAELGVEDLSERRDVRARSPLRSAIQAESQVETQRSFALCLHLYLAMFNRLSAKERRALELVEVEERSYRETADLLGIKVENLKMVIFRARKKIFRAMHKVMSHAS
jgi:RNA polymerase sigma factor (sigma-70 family)